MRRFHNEVYPYPTDCIDYKKTNNYRPIISGTWPRGAVGHPPSSTGILWQGGGVVFRGIIRATPRHALVREDSLQWPRREDLPSEREWSAAIPVARGVNPEAGR